MAQTLAMPLASSLSIVTKGRGGSAALLPDSISFSKAPASKYRGLNIRCVRVAGVEIPNHKRVEYSLQHIHGVGRTVSRIILWNLGMENKVTKDLTEKELIALRGAVTAFMIEGDLRRYNKRNIQRLKDIRCYRGLRHERGLPCRGQRTKNNCRTLKGRRVTVAGKKQSER